jgi:AcrR family transcriptional regulator
MLYMYHHFSGKADLAHAAIERLAEELDDDPPGSFQ